MHPHLMELLREKELFNPDRKLAFLTERLEKNRIALESVTNYLRVFSFFKLYEQNTLPPKDLTYFTLEEIEDAFMLRGFREHNSAQTFGRLVTAYLEWNKKEGHIKDNPLSALNVQDFERYITDPKEYLTESTLRAYEDECLNYQDAALLRLIFEGLEGPELSIISNLKKEEVDFHNNRLIISKQNGVGYLFPVDDYTLKLLEGASTQQKYHKKNGEIKQTSTGNINPLVSLVHNDYVFRPSITRIKNPQGPADCHVFYRRIDAIEQHVGHPRLTSKLIRHSGMLAMAYHLTKGKNTISSDDIQKVAQRFYVKSEHNLKNLLTMENIQRIYPNNEKREPQV